MNVHCRCWSISRLITPNCRFTYIHVHVSMEHSSCLSALLVRAAVFFPLKLGSHGHDHHRAQRKPIKLSGQHLSETRTPKQVSFDDTLGTFLGVLSPNSSTVLGASLKRTPMFIASDCQLSWWTYYLQIIHNWNHRNFQCLPRFVLASSDVHENQNRTVDSTHFWSLPLPRSGVGKCPILGILDITL